MNELEKKILNAWNISPACAEKIAKIALEEIKAAFKEGYAIGDDMRYDLTDSLEKYLKQKGYE